MKKYLAFSILLFALSSGFVIYTHSSNEITAYNPWVKLAPPGTPMAGYMVLYNGTSNDRKIVGAKAGGFAMTMIHRSLHENGVAKMERVDAAQLVSGDSLLFAPGGLHLMLMTPQKSFHEGDTVPITLNFDDGSTFTVRFPVRSSVDESAGEYRHDDHSGYGHEKAAESHNKHEHNRIVRVAQDNAPTLAVSVKPMHGAHWVLELETGNFVFAEAHQDGPHVMGEGHAHLYINGEKIARLFSTEFRLPDLPPGKHEIVVGLYSNDHAAYAIEGKPVEQRVTILAD